MLLSLFGRKDKTNEQDNNPVSPSSLPRAVAFVDYESWYVSLKTTYAIAPDIKGWFEELNRHYQLIDVTFFADFSHRSLADELRRIRPYTNKIIDTRSPNGVEKDYTDFIMLDNIYQKALSASDIQTFILFSGDGHFSSVVAFLKNFYHKNVVVYGIQDCFSAQLREAASETVTLPDEKQLNRGIYQTIFDYLRRASAPTYDGALQYVTDKHRNVSRKTIQNAMDLLEKREVLSQRNLPGSKSRQLFVSWENAEEWLDVPLAEYLAQPVEPLRPNNRNERTEGRRPDEANRHREHGEQPHFQLKDAHGSPDRKQKESSQKQKPDEKKQPAAEQAPKQKQPEKQPQKPKQPEKQASAQDSRPQKADKPKNPEPKDPPKTQEPKKPEANPQPKQGNPKNGTDADKKQPELAKQPASQPAEPKAAELPQNGNQPDQKQPQRKKASGKKKAEPKTDPEPKAEKPKPGPKAKKLKTDAHKAEDKTETKPEPENASKPADGQPKQENKPKQKQPKQPSPAQPKEDAKSEPKPEPVPADGNAEKPKSSGRRRRRSGSKPKAASGTESAPESNASPAEKPAKETE